MTALVQDLTSSLRRLLSHPAEAAAAILTLALGLGACTAIFSLVDAVLLRPLPFADAQQLVTLWETHPQQPAGYRVASYPTADAWRRDLDELSALAVSRSWRPVLARGEDWLSVEGAKVSAEFFAVLGIEPLIGRSLTPADAAPDADPVVLISHRLWQLRFGGEASAVDSRILLAGAPQRLRATIVGVLPPAVDIGRPLAHANAEIFAPLTGRDTSNHFGQRYFRVVGRLADGTRIETAREHLRAAADRLAAARPATNSGWGATMESLREQRAAPIRSALRALVAGVALVFLVACCNVGILLMSQASVRRRELAVRLALGAGAWRVGRLVLIECLLLALGGGALGLWLAHQGVALLAVYVDTLPSSQDLAIDRHAFCFALGLALATVVLLGMAPAVRFARLDLRSALADLAGRRRLGAGGPRDALVVIELALSSMLLVVASIMIASFQRLATTDPGFEPRGVTTLRLRAVDLEARGSARRDLLYLGLLRQTAPMPGMNAAGLISQAPLSGSGMSSHAAPGGRPEEPIRVEFRGVSSGIFAALGIPVIERRDLHLLDRGGGERAVVVISELAARRFWPGGGALGRRLVLDWGDRRGHEVIGVVGDVRHPSAPAEVQPTIYLPFRQAPHRVMTLVLRGEPRGDLAAAVRARVRALGWPLVVDQPRDLSAAVAASIAEPRARAFLVAAFALTAVLLAAGGTYGAVALAVEQRRHDASVRLVLGADPRRLVREAMTEVLKPVALGISLGLCGSLALTRALSSVLYDVGLQDPRPLIGTAAVMTLVAGLAGYLPANRLSKSEPAACLRVQ